MAAVDHVVAIAGATGAAGRAAAAAFAHAGARLGLIGTDESRLRALADELGLTEDRWQAGVGDLTSATGARAAVSPISEALGHIEVLLHVVGGWTGGTPTVEVGTDDFDSMLGQHL